MPFSNRVPVDHLVILAPGLLGGSVAKASRARALAGRITLWARKPETRARLADQLWCDAVAATPEEAVREASLVVVAAPVERIIELVARIAPHLPPGAVVTDVGSVKARLCRLCHDAMPPGRHFVGSHPMAGSEKIGWENGSETLFDRRVCFVTPFAESDPTAAETVARLWRGLGSEVVTVAPAEHDRIVAHISHLPQVAATSLATLLSSMPAGWRDMAGGGLRDTTRIAGSDATMWIEILQQNRDEVLGALHRYQGELDGFRAALEKQDWDQIRARLELGKSWRDGFRG